MFFFYVLYSLQDGRLYKGHSSDLIARLERHNAGGTRSTKHRRPLILLYFERYESNEEAIRRELWSKTLEGGALLRKLLQEKGLLNAKGGLNDQSSAG